MYPSNDLNAHGRSEMMDSGEMRNYINQTSNSYLSMSVSPSRREFIPFTDGMYSMPPCADEYHTNTMPLCANEYDNHTHSQPTATWNTNAPGTLLYPPILIESIKKLALEAMKPFMIVILSALIDTVKSGVTDEEIIKSLKELSHLIKTGTPEEMMEVIAEKKESEDEISKIISIWE